MKLDIKIRWIMDIDGHNEGDVQTLTLDCDYIDNKGDLLQSIEDEIGGYDEDIHYEILNEEQFWQDIDCPASEITNPQALVKEDPRIEKIRGVLRRYFDATSDEYDPNFSAEDAIEEVETIVGNYEKDEIEC